MTFCGSVPWGWLSRIFGIGGGACTFIGALWGFGCDTDFHDRVIFIYMMIFGGTMTLIEFYWPNSILVFIKFYHNYLGRGLFMLFCGCLGIGRCNNGMPHAMGIITMICAFYFILASPIAIFGLFPEFPIHLPAPLCAGKDAESTIAPTSAGTATKPPPKAPVELKVDDGRGAYD